MVSIITSQHYLDDEIVAAKLAARDFEVILSPVFEVDGEQFQVVMDGNHSLAAAQLANAVPEYSVATKQTSDRVQLLEDGNIEGFLEAEHMGDSDHIDAITRKNVW